MAHRSTFGEGEDHGQVVDGVNHRAGDVDD
jgi:hypothetical protein